ncbi:MAG: PTS transporter subunit EIIC [Erysipelotrichaceae bacterium]|nr:PTS transporter subunit EIIC [Erysipelotrichaceae bacterium]
MERFQEVLIKFGTAASENKYLKCIKNAFQTFLPFTIIGAIGVLWSHVIVNANTGLGALIPQVMALQFLNPAFNALNFCTIGCISAGIVFLVGSELAKENKQSGTFGGILAFIAFISVTNTATVVSDEAGNVIATVRGIFSGSLGSTGMFTAMIMAVIAVELFSKLYSVDALKIKMPEQVPPGVARSFEYLIPAFLVLLVTALLGLACVNLTGNYLNDLIFNLVQQPLLKIGGSLPGILVFLTVSCMFWSVGLHGDNMIGGVLEPIIVTLMLENTAAVEAGLAPTNIINYSFYRAFMATGGTGAMLSLTLAMFLLARRDENKSVARLAIVPNMFNIGEVNMFGFPVVLNPLLIIPFILAPIASVIFGYVVTAMGLCPVMFIQVPWTMPPFLMGFLASGGNFMGGLFQLLGIVVGMAVYLPFVKMYERQQAQVQVEEALEAA